MAARRGCEAHEIGASIVKQKDIQIFRYPLGIRIGYPFAFATWLLAPALPVIVRYILYSLSGVSYTFTFSGYLSHPIVALIVASLWAAAVYLQYLAVKSRSTILISSEFIESASFLGNTSLSWSGVELILKRRQIFRNGELHTFFAKWNHGEVIFCNRLVKFEDLVQTINAISAERNIPLFVEDYEVRPIERIRVPNF
jgi:hypothetical protein